MHAYTHIHTPYLISRELSLRTASILMSLQQSNIIKSHNHNFMSWAVYLDSASCHDNLAATTDKRVFGIVIDAPESDL